MTTEICKKKFKYTEHCNNKGWAIKPRLIEVKQMASCLINMHKQYTYSICVLLSI